MLTNQFWRSLIHKFLTTSCLVFFAVIVVFATSPSYAIAKELALNSGRAVEVNQNLSEVLSQGSGEKKFAFEPKSGILAEINQKFHEDYDKLIAQITATFGKPEGPTVLFFTMNKLIAYHDGIREEQEFIPPLYHQLKAIEHHPVTLYATLQAYEGQKLTEPLRDFLKERSKLLQETLISLNEQNWYPNIVDNQKTLLADSIVYINQTLEEGYINGEKLNNYVRLVNPKIIAGVNSATVEQLKLLNEKIKNLRSKDKWKSPYVVISSVHQARSGEIVTQYFEHMFNEFQGIGASREDRIVYAESIFDDEPKALRLLATHILDQKIASAFFRDPKRLQSDALMDAAKFWLWEHTMEIPKWP